MEGLRERLRLYVVTSAGMVPGRGHLEVVRAAVRGGATAVQLRATELQGVRLLPLAADSAAMCRGAGLLFVVNDDLDVALESGADGVHLGQDDRPGEARRRLGSGRVLGISVQSLAHVQQAEELGADYVGVTVWATATKPGAAPLDLEGVRAVTAATSLPIVGIGGIGAANAAQVMDAGAAGVAVVSAVGAAEDPEAAVRTLRQAVDAAGGAHLSR